MSGSIPSELSDLANLTRLNLEDNHLIGTVPPQLGKLTNLEVWYLSGNRLDGCVPAGWQNIRAHDLNDLGVSFCYAPPPPLTAATDRDALIALYRSANGNYWFNNSHWLSDAPLNTWYGVTTDENGRVIGLYLGKNGLWGTIPSELGNLTSLQGLSLSDNLLNGTIPSEMGKLTNLEWLYLDSNQLCGTVPPELGELTNLTELILYSNQLQGTIPPELGNLTNLEILYLDSNQLARNDSVRN